METRKKRDILNMVASLDEANEYMQGAVQKNPESLSEMLMQCQDAAMQIGTSLEAMGDQYAASISLLEDYCENIYQMSVNLSDKGKCQRLCGKMRRQLMDLKHHVRYQVPDDRREVVFLPYKASMWDSLESVWKAADADKDTDAYVIPIPYYDKNPDGSFREEHYEGDLYPDDVPIVRYDEYDFEGRRPDAIFIHNAYDEYNFVTSVHPFFYSPNLKKFTDKLIYIPYFVLSEIKPDDKAALDSIRHFCIAQGVYQADKVIVQSENMRQAYINVLTEETLKNQGGSEMAIRKYWEDKIDGSGSPKFDKVLNTKREDLAIPSDWMKMIEKTDGTYKKIIFYNISIAAFLEHDAKMLDKIQDVLRVFRENQQEIALLWRPHPLIESTLLTMRPQLWEEYRRIRDGYIQDGWGIYDDTADIDRAIVLSDAYYGDMSSVVQLYQKTGKPVMIQNVDVLS